MTTHCNCESSYCHHYENGLSACPNVPSGTFRMDYVGAVCDGCAQAVISTGGGEYIHFNEKRGLT